MPIHQLKEDDLFGVSVVDATHSKVVCPNSLRREFMTYLQSQGINCTLGTGVVTIGKVTGEVEVILAEAGVARIYALLHNYMQ